MLGDRADDDNHDAKAERWETYKRGRLTEVQYDTNADGKPDRTESEGIDGPVFAKDAVSCDGSALPEPPPDPNAVPAAAPVASTVPTQGGETSGEPAPIDRPRRP